MWIIYGIDIVAWVRRVSGSYFAGSQRPSQQCRVTVFSLGVRGLNQTVMEDIRINLIIDLYNGTSIGCKMLNFFSFREHSSAFSFMVEIFSAHLRVFEMMVHRNVINSVMFTAVLQR